MKLSLIPRERRFYDLFKRQGSLVSETLTELSKSLLEGRSRLRSEAPAKVGQYKQGHPAATN